MKRAWLGLAAMLLTAAPASAQSLIVRSVGPSKAKYPVGTRLTNDAALMLVEGDRVVLLDRHGTREITRQRPVSLWMRRDHGRIAQSDQSGVQEYLCQFAGRCEAGDASSGQAQPEVRAFRLTRRGDRAAAARSAPLRRPTAEPTRAAPSPSPSARAFAVPVEVDATGSWCISEARSVLFLDRSARLAPAALRRLDGKPLDLAQTDAALLWRHDVSAGKPMVLTRAGRRITVLALPESAWQGTPVDLAARFIAARCQGSLDRLLEQQAKLGGWVVAGTSAP